MHEECSAIPIIKFANHTYPNCIGCPHCEMSACHPIHHHGMCAHFLIGFIIYASKEGSFILFCEKSAKCVGVLKVLRLLLKLYLKFIIRNSSPWDQHCIIASLVLQLHFIFLVPCNHCRSSGFRKKALYQHTIRCQSRSHHISWRCLFPVYNRFNFWPVHIIIYCFAHKSLHFPANFHGLSDFQKIC